MSAITTLLQVPEAGFVSGEKRAAVEAAGLHWDLDLTQACADFYLLERIWDETHGWDGDTRMRRGLYSDYFGEGSRRELLAYSAAKDLQDLETWIAEEFVKYIVLATGGEARYARQYFDASTLLRKRSTGLVKAWGSGRWYSGPAVERFFRHLWDDKMDNVISTSNRKHMWRLWWDIAHDAEYWSLSDAMRQLGKMFFAPHWMTHQGVTNNHLPIQLANGDYFKPEHIVLIIDEQGRVLGSPTTDYAESSIAAMNGQPDYPKVSIGGPSWGRPCFLVADYLDGKMSTRTFVDRCWSIQHNGGSLFNKLYLTSVLQNVLARQEAGDYNSLYRFASPEVQRAWIEHTWKPGEVTPPQSIRFHGPNPQSGAYEGMDDEGNDLSNLCLACGAYYDNTGVYDPCMHNLECTYADDYGIYETEYNVYSDSPNTDCGEHCYDCYPDNNHGCPWGEDGCEWCTAADEDEEEDEGEDEEEEEETDARATA